MTATEVVPEAAPETPGTSTLQDRVLRLERDNRRLRRLGTFVLVGLGVLLGLEGALIAVTARRAFPGTIAPILEARQFTLRDAAGNARAILGVQDSSARLIMLDPAGHQRVTLSVLQNGAPGLSFRDETGHARLVLGLLPDQTTTLVFADRQGVTRTVLGLAQDESSTLVFADHGGTTQAGLGIDRDGRPTFTFDARHADSTNSAGSLGAARPIP
jgi:hypothetical protein